jgi:hypothetical protein
MRDLAHNIAIRQSLAPAVRTASADGSEIDRAGFESVTFAVHVGDWSDGAHAVSAEHHDEGGDWEAVAAGDLIGAMPVVQSNGESPELGLNANATAAIGYIGDKQFVRPKVTVTGSPGTGAFIGVDVILSHAHDRPTA